MHKDVILNPKNRITNTQATVAQQLNQGSSRKRDVILFGSPPERSRRIGSPERCRRIGEAKKNKKQKRGLR